MLGRRILKLPKVLSLNWTESFKVARGRQSPYAADAVSFLSRLHAMKSVPVLLYCVSEKRAWMDTTSRRNHNSTVL